MAYLKLRDAEIYYEVYGEGRPFLFCSATGVDGQCWKAYQVPEFSRDHKVIIFDYRGTGRSSKTVINYSTAMFAADAAAISMHWAQSRRSSAVIPTAEESSRF